MWVVLHSGDAMRCLIVIEVLWFYYPPEVRSMKYCCLGVFRKEYFRLVT